MLNWFELLSRAFESSNSEVNRLVSLCKTRIKNNVENHNWSFSQFDIKENSTFLMSNESLANFFLSFADSVIKFFKNRSLIKKAKIKQSFTELVQTLNNRF